MWINPVVVGVIGTLFVEIAIIAAIAIIGAIQVRYRKRNRK